MSAPAPMTVRETSVRYFRRRAAEERQAANQAADPRARAAHHELAERYARMSNSVRLRPGQRATVKRSTGKPPGRAGNSRARRQDDLLDDALRGTFPASDPISMTIG